MVADARPRAVTGDPAERRVAGLAERAERAAPPHAARRGAHGLAELARVEPPTVAVRRRGAVLGAVELARGRGVEPAPLAHDGRVRVAPPREVVDSGVDAGLEDEVAAARPLGRRLAVGPALVVVRARLRLDDGAAVVVVRARHRLDDGAVVVVVGARLRLENGAVVVVCG